MICVSTGGYDVSLQVWKVYRLLESAPGDPKTWLRIVDESGEDYLYPWKYVRPLSLPKPVERALAASG